MIAIATRRAMEAMRVADGWLTTSGTGMRSVPRVNIYYLYPFFQSFVLDKALELGKRPRVMDIPLLFPYLRPFPNMSKLLHNDNITFLEAINNPSAYVVVNPANYSALLARKPFQESFGSFRAFGLESRPQGLIPPPNMHSLLARKPKSVGGCGKVIDTKVYSYHLAVISWLGLWKWSRKNDINIELSTSADKVGMGRLLSFKKMPLVTANNKRNFNSTFNSGERNHLFGFNKAEDALVIGNRSGFKLLDLISSYFIGNRSPCYCSYGEVGRKPKFFLDVIVASLLKFKLVACLEFLGFTKNIIARISKGFKGGIKAFSLLRSYFKFTSNRLNKFHLDLIISLKEGGVKGAFLPPLKEWASCASLCEAYNKYAS